MSKSSSLRQAIDILGHYADRCVSCGPPGTHDSPAALFLARLARNDARASFIHQIRVLRSCTSPYNRSCLTMFCDTRRGLTSPALYGEGRGRMRRIVVLLALMVAAGLLASGLAWAAQVIRCERGSTFYHPCSGTNHADIIRGTKFND